jgi:RNA polymerase sigma-70 factor (ECF subfamily)
MPHDNAFLELIRRVCAGDEAASAELVKTYEPVIRVAVRVRLDDSGLRTLFDSMDISQSVLGNFFARAALGQFELEKPEQLMNLLVTMARNRLINHARKHKAARRDHRRTTDAQVVGEALSDPQPSPSQIISNKELLQEFRNRLTPAERQLAEQRAAGKSWSHIAAQNGGSADALRMQLTRGLDRVARELQLTD